MKEEHIVIAMDSFKGSATSIQLAEWLEKGIRRAIEPVQVTKVPIADGGEGTVEALTTALAGEFIEVNVSDPLKRPVTAKFGLLQDHTAVIEMAQSSGITLIDQTEENALQASSYGLGQQILAALNHGAKEIYVGIGGSATNDGGVGMAQALGASFKDSHGQEIASGAAGLKELAQIDLSQLDARIKATPIHVLSDVANPLTGENGAIHIYGHQKGLTKERLAEVDQWMKKYSDVIQALLNISIDSFAGAGAAGGTGAALMAFFGADFYQGIDKILELLNVSDKLSKATAVFTGEGFLDAQTVNGKAPIGIAKLAKKYELPVIAIAGACEDDLSGIYEAGIDLVLTAINRPMSLKEAFENVEKNVINAGENAARALVIKRKVNGQ